MIGSSDELGKLRPWHRFHVRTTFGFGAGVLVLLAALGGLSYRFAAEAEISILRGRLHGLAVGLARTLDADSITSLRVAADHDSSAHRELTAHFARVADEEPEVESIYVMRPTDRPGWVRFAIDWVRSGTPGEVGELYDATQTDGMLAAFRAPVVESRVYRDAWGRHLSGYAPIRDATGSVVAIVGIDMSARRVAAAERRALTTTLTMYGVAVVLFVIGGVLLGRNVRRPIERIIAATSAIAGGELDARTHLERDDELGLLARRIDRMAEDLEERERIRALFGRYVSEDVARKVLGGGAAEGAVEREVTVLFTDIRRYSTISESLPPHDVLELLNDYFSEMTDVIDAHQGCVIELLGDAILAVFGAPAELPDHAACAVRAACAMRDRLEGLNEEWEASGRARVWKERGVERMGARIGVHTGLVVAGSLGGKRRAKYTVLGPAVGVAMKLEALNETLGTSILVSAETLAALPPELAARAVPAGEHRVRAGEPPRALSSL
ncbi:MAG: HAMP domain-containing protein [Sandaracinaceae bacterium]|nr:HAMP domain-containing protein [Sandaracinaceae bacterium]